MTAVDHIDSTKIAFFQQFSVYKPMMSRYMPDLEKTAKVASAVMALLEERVKHHTFQTPGKTLIFATERDLRSFMKKIVIAIDGYSGCGKSTTAKEVARILGYTYIDSGAMYRAVTLHFLNRFTNLTNPKEVEKSLQTFKVEFHKDDTTGEQLTFLNGLNVEKEIRSMRVSEMVSEVSKIKEVRKELVAQQKRLGKHKAVVMDGRDIGTVVFPDAELKVFMTADIHIRAARRQKEILDKGQLVKLEDVVKNLAERDRIDSTRAESPLVKAADALEVDTSYLSFEDQVDTIVNMAKEKIAA